MQCFTPTFYHTFHCVAANCPDSCCKEWEVDIDRETATFYLGLPGELGDRLRSVLRIQDDGSACMTIENGRCPMWQQDGLCRIQAELGHDALSCVCREFPRLRHDYGDFVELGLELSCPEAARLILNSDYTLEYIQTAQTVEPEYDRELMDILLHSRSQALTLLDSNSFSMPQKLAILLLYAHDVQAQIDGGDTAVLTPEQNLKEAKKYAKTGNISLLTAFFADLEILTPQWKALLQHPRCSPSWDFRTPALVQYLIHRYWLQAISDYDLLSRAKFIITACLLVNSLEEAFPTCAQVFSKEIENDPDNVDALMDGAYCSPALTDIHLLSLLLNP